MSSFFPAARKPSFSFCAWAGSPYTRIRCRNRYDFSDASATYQSGCPL